MGHKKIQTFMEKTCFGKKLFYFQWLIFLSEGAGFCELTLLLVNWYKNIKLAKFSNKHLTQFFQIIV